ncbi:MAG: DUF3299 domain-containing protein [Planctomycetota bacterium]
MRTDIRSLFTVAGVVAMLPAAFAAQSAAPPGREVPLAWSVLAPQEGKPFIDPFTELSDDQLTDLSFVVRVQRLIADKRLDPEGPDAKEAARLSRQLEQQGIDVPWLMAQRDRVRQVRGVQVEALSKSVASQLQNRVVSLTGFVIPIKLEHDRLTEFFLVPTLAACSHEDPPPRLQVVFVSTQPGIAVPERRSPVSVTGELKAIETTRTTANGSGPVTVHAAYALRSPRIESPPTRPDPSPCRPRLKPRHEGRQP